jgi:hypothetical protein
MAAPLMVGMTSPYDVSGGYLIRIAAIDATTGSDVAGVNIQNAFILATDNTEDEPPPNPDPANGAYTQGLPV